MGVARGPSFTHDEFSTFHSTMATPATMTKEERDKTRLRTGNKQRKRLHVLRNPEKLAFRGWEEVLQPWSFEDCANYIEWCHIDKAFPEERHNYHRRFHKANLKHCIDEAFKNRCIEVYQVLYDLPNVKRNEVNLFIARGVHAEVKLNKRVDWSTLKAVGDNIKIPTPANGLIPMGVRRYPHGGLGKIKTMIGPIDRYETDPSSTDSDSDGSHAVVVLSRRAEQRIKRRRAGRAINEVTNEVVAEVQLSTNDEPAVEHLDVVAATETMESLRNQLKEKDAESLSLHEEVRKLREEVNDKNFVIHQQQRDIEELQLALQAATMTTTIDDSRGEDEGRLPMAIQEDSLSFDELRATANIATVDEDGSAARDKGKELTDVVAKNLALQKQLDAVVEQYYQWKLACVFTIDRARQLAVEFKKIDNNYTTHNQERVFGLTSWALVDDLFNETTSISDFKTQLSSTVGGPGNPTLIWPSPPSFVSDGTKCPICINPFGPEGGMHLGTCEHLYHPFCLISLMVVRRRCSLCKAPFHERLYELFGLIPYMPPHWEYNPENAPDHTKMWGTDLVWSWKLQMHSLDKKMLCTESGWERDPELIVNVCHNMIPNRGELSQGRRNFFFQCFNGHWDEVGKKFRFGPHPRKWKWSVDGVRITDDNGVVIIPEDNLQPNPMDLVVLSESEWMETFRNDGVDFLLDQHSPETRRALNELMQSQILRAVLEEDGPARRTRSASRRLVLGPAEDFSTQVGTHDNEAGPSGTANSPMNID